MTRDGTPIEHYPEFSLYVKREDLSCPGGPDFSKTRGVFAHIRKRREKFIGVLDTRHSQGGWAVARACAELGKTCVEFYPVLKNGSPDGGVVQQKCRELKAQLLPLKAGRSAVLYHQAKKWLMGNIDPANCYMMPNALKLPEMVMETAAEVRRTEMPPVDTVLISASSGTIAAGLIRGLRERNWRGRVIVHLGYSRPLGAVKSYMEKMAGVPFGLGDVDIIDEQYGYADEAEDGATPPFACNSYYDLKAFRWFLQQKRTPMLMWNIG